MENIRDISALEQHEVLDETYKKDGLMRAFYLHDIESTPEDYEDTAMALNELTEHRRRQPVALDHIFYLHNGSLTGYHLDEEDVVVGRFEEFLANPNDGPSGIYVRLFAEVSGVPKEEVLPLWNQEARALRWPNFDSRPRPKLGFWRKVLRIV